MKKALICILTVCLLLACCGCTKEKTDISDYLYMYDGIFEDWKKHTNPYEGQDSLLGFGEYMYNSELILFPRQTPSTLKEFYFHWTALMDVDGYAIYFTCGLDEVNYTSFVDELEMFEVSNGTQSVKLLYNAEDFSLPTYIAQWVKVEEKWEVLEYVMLDEATHTVIFVYTMGELERIEENSSYTVAPTNLHFIDEDFSIYSDFNNSTYDISFLEYLK